MKLSVFASSRVLHDVSVRNTVVSRYAVAYARTWMVGVAYSVVRAVSLRRLSWLEEFGSSKRFEH